MKNYISIFLVALFAFSSILALLLSTSCNMGNNTDDVPLYDTVYHHLPIFDTVFKDADYVDMTSYYGNTHFDSTIIYNGTDDILTQMYGFPILFTSEGIDTEVRFMGGFLQGDREGPIYFPPIYWDSYEWPSEDNIGSTKSADVHPDYDPSIYDSIFHETIYFHEPTFPAYAIAQIKSEGVITTDTVFLNLYDDLVNRHEAPYSDHYYEDWKSALRFHPDGFLDDKLLFENNEYEVYFADVAPYMEDWPEAVDYALIIVHKE